MKELLLEGENSLERLEISVKGTAGGGWEELMRDGGWRKLPHQGAERCLKGALGESCSTVRSGSSLLLGEKLSGCGLTSLLRIRLVFVLDITPLQRGP